MSKCIDCGDAPVIHQVEWISAVVGKYLMPKNIPFGKLFQNISRTFSGPLYNVLTPVLMTSAVRLHLSTFADAPDERTSKRARVMWEESPAHGVQTREFRLFGVAREAFLSTYNGTHKTFLDLPRPGDTVSEGLLWMDDKEIVRERLQAAGVPVARGGVVTSAHGARALFERLRPPLIAKPEIGSRSRHTTTHILTSDDVVAAFHKAAVLSPWVIIEEEEVGYVYRGTTIGGKVVAVLRREPPLVRGDGEHTVRELVARENANPRRDNVVFHTIEIDQEAQEELTRQALTLDSVPAQGSIVTFSQKASRGIGGGTTDVTDDIHADNKDMLETVAAVVNDPLIGIDFIIPDITRSWKDQDRTGVIECNSMPFIDLHHYPLVGSPRNVAGALWDLVTSEWRAKR